MSVSHSAPWHSEISRGTEGPAITGYVLTFLMAATFGVWGAFAPIEGAVVASGTIAAAGRNVQIQHLEGGIVRGIYAHEGDAVKRDDVIISLDDTAATTQVNRLSQQWLSLKFRIRRLEAERDNQNEFMPNSSTASLGDPQATEIVREENKEFDARLARFRSEKAILVQRLDQLFDAKDGLAKQSMALQQQAAVVKDELSRKRDLLAKGLVNRSDYTELLRIDADLLGQQASIAAQRASTGSQIAEAHEQLERLANQRVEDAVTKLNEAKDSIRDVQEQLTAAAEVLSRTKIRAPVDGVVVTAAYNVIGNVISSGEKLMEILPTIERPLVEAHIQTTDVDSVRINQKARLRLSALNARLTPEIEAEVIEVSADRLVEQTTQQPYYRAILKISNALPSSIHTSDLRPGMPVEVFIDTGDRTFFEYILKPVIDSTRRAFVEE